MFVLMLVVGPLAAPTPAVAQAILNVERLQADQVQGVHVDVSARVSASAGNTEILQIGWDIGSGLLKEQNWFRAFAGMEILEKNGQDLRDNRYAHLRYSRLFNPRFRSFHFLQFQSNENLLIQRRWLLGSGLRLRVAEEDGRNLDVGLGAMYETERLRESALEPEDDPETETIRMANMAVASWAFSETARLVGIVYYQPDVSAFSDYRLTGDVALSVTLTQALSLEVSVDWRHDSRAPANLEQDDVRLRTGFNLRFR